MFEQCILHELSLPISFVCILSSSAYRCAMALLNYHDHRTAQLVYVQEEKCS